MANILIAFYNGLDEKNGNRIPAFYEAFIEGFKKAGNMVYVMPVNWGFCMEFPDIDEEMADSIRQLNLDICFLFNNCFLDISDVIDCPIVIYDVDSPIYFSNQSRILNNVDRYVFFTTQTESAETIKRVYGAKDSQIFEIPLFTSIEKDATAIFDKNISFIGTNFLKMNEMALQRVMKADVSKEEIEALQLCYEYCSKHPFDNPKAVISTVFKDKAEKIFELMKWADIRMNISAERRVEVLSCLYPLGLTIYGTKNWKYDYYGHFNLNIAYNETEISSIADNQYVYNTSKIGINVSHIQAQSGFPWRVLDIMASNACLVTDYHVGFKKLFPEVMDILPVYSTAGEAYMQCWDLLNDESRRREIVLRCNEAAEKYRFSFLLEKIEQNIGISLHV